MYVIGTVKFECEVKEYVLVVLLLVYNTLYIPRDTVNFCSLQKTRQAHLFTCSSNWIGSYRTLAPNIRLISLHA